MTIDQKHVGVTSEPRFIDVEKGQLRFFAKATGESNAIYFDEGAARDAGHPAIPAPPTFLFSLHLGAPAQRGDIFDSKNGIGANMQRILHGEQQFTYHRPIYAGDRMSLVTTTREILEKKGGALELIIQDTQAHNAVGQLCVEMRTTTVVRND